MTDSEIAAVLEGAADIVEVYGYDAETYGLGRECPHCQVGALAVACGAPDGFDWLRDEWMLSVEAALKEVVPVERLEAVLVYPQPISGGREYIQAVAALSTQRNLYHDDGSALAREFREAAARLTAQPVACEPVEAV